MNDLIRINSKNPFDFDLIRINSKNPFDLPCTFYVKVEFPSCIQHDGKRYWRTGKVGVQIDTEIPTAEYKFNEDRIWMNANTNISLG